MKSAIIDVGGGLRGIYGAGIFDACLEDGVHFDLCIGVSAGSANTASFLAGQKGRNYRFYIDYAKRKEYMSFHNFLKTGSYLGLSYIYGTLSNSDGEDPLDYAKIKANPADWLIVASEATTGNPYYFTKEEMQQDNYFPLMASSCLPGVDKPMTREGVDYFDGGIADPVPLEKALSMGYDKIVVLLTKPREDIELSKSDKLIAKMVKKSYPAISKNLLLRAKRYNQALHQAEQLEKEGKALIVAPKEIAGLKTLTKDEKALRMLYEMGLADGKAILPFLEKNK